MRSWSRPSPRTRVTTRRSATVTPTAAGPGLAGSADAGAEAAADLRRALELWAKLPHRNGDPQFEQSRAPALLAGLGRDAKSGVTKEEAKEFAERSVAALAAAVKTGRADPSELKEPDFDALCGRDDFTKLLAELEAKSGPKPKPKG